jgi:hypothetical protein
MKYKIEGVSGEVFAKRMVFLAWKACGGPVGMGFLQDRGSNVPEDDLWKHAYNNADYSGGRKLLGPRDSHEVYCDYVMGRMMKFGVKFEDDFIEVREPSNWRSDYESFCYVYKDFPALIKAAAESLKVTAIAETASRPV